jgi:hypothetical protein
MLQKILDGKIQRMVFNIMRKEDIKTMVFFLFRLLGEPEDKQQVSVTLEVEPLDVYDARLPRKS